MWPCRPPAKKARIERLDGEGPPRRPTISPVFRLISGSETSFWGLKPSEVLALHNTLMELLNRFGTYVVEYGPCKSQFCYIGDAEFLTTFSHFSEFFLSNINVTKVKRLKVEKLVKM